VPLLAWISQPLNRMKPISFFVFLFLIPLTMCWSQSTHSLSPGSRQKTEAIVPPAAEQKFVIEHPDAHAQWKKDGEYYKAIFVNPVNSLGQVTVYDKAGHIIRKERELEQQEIPPTISEFQEKKFPGEGFAVWVSTDSLGNNIFYTQKNNNTYWFDRNGQLLSGKGHSLSDSLTGPSR
jgi:hypothetical protein